MNQDYKELALEMLAIGKPITKISVILEKHFKYLDEQEFNAKLLEEYNSLGYWQEKVIQELIVADEGNVIQEEITMPELIEGKPTFEQYKNETKVMTEAIEPTYNEDGLLLAEGVSEVTEPVRPYVAKDNFDTEITAFLLPYEKEKALNKITELENEALRPTRELILDSTNKYAKKKLEAIESELVTLRSLV